MYSITKMLRTGGMLLFVVGVLLVAACKNPAGSDTQEAPPPDKTSLNNKITEAQELYDSLGESSIGGADIDTDVYWVSSKWNLFLAIDDAQNIAGLPNATDEEIQHVLEALTVAYNAANNAKKLGTKGNPNPVDKSALIAKLAEARVLNDNIEVSADGTDIDKDKYWVSSALKNALAAAIAAADGVVNNANTAQPQVQTALDTLASAYNAANNAKLPGTKDDSGEGPDPDLVDKRELLRQIAEAEALAAYLKTSVNGHDIPPNEEWVSASAKSKLDDAIQAAQDVAGNENAASAEVEYALQALIIACDEADASKKPGTTPDKDALRAKITETGNKMKNVHKSDTGGSEYRVDEKWVAPAVYDALQAALTAAEGARDNANAAKVAVDAALANLIAAFDNFNPQPGISVADKDELNALIGEVAEKLARVQASDNNGADIYDTDEWVTPAEKEALQAVLDTARGIAGNAATPQEEVDAMKEALETAFGNLNPQSGTKAVGHLGIDVTFKLPGDETITLTGAQTLSWFNNTELTITVTETFTAYQWYVDGALKNGETGISITLYAGDFPVGSTHTVTLEVKKGGIPYTKSLQFRVEY